MKKFLFLIGFIPILFFSQIPAGYYDAANGLTGYALKSKLHEIISKKHYSYNYSQVIPFYSTTDVDTYYENDGSVLDIYSEKPLGADSYQYNFTQNIGDAASEGLGWNREHGMPQSTYYGAYPMYSDIHYLIPTDAYINQRRSNFPYARNNGENITFTNGSKLGKSTTPGYTNTVYEPIDEFKGDVARYLLYFVTRYEGILHLMNHQLSTMPLDGSEEKAYEDWYITLLKEWNALDPVSQRERDRNNAVFGIQKLRNPFIDHPEYVNLIWNETSDNVAPQSPTNLVVSAIGESYVTLSWTPSIDTDVLGYKIYVNGTYYGDSKTNTISVDRLTAGTSYNFIVKAYDKKYLLSSDSNLVNATTLVADQLASDLMITKYIEGNTNNTAIEITNKTGHEVNLNNYFLNIQFNGGANGFYFSDPFQLEGKIAPNEALVIVNPKSTFANYNPSEGDFVTNSTPMSFTGSQYLELSYGTKTIKTVSTNNYELKFTTVDAIGVKSISNTNNNKSLYRNLDVLNPNINFTIAEWTVYPSNYTQGLGTYLSTNTPEKEKEEFVIYPNPVEDILYIKGKKLNNVSQIEIFDFNGKKLKTVEKPFESNLGVDVSDLVNGVYFIKINNESLKFIKL